MLQPDRQLPTHRMGTPVRDAPRSGLEIIEGQREYRSRRKVLFAASYRFKGLTLKTFTGTTENESGAKKPL